MRERKVNTLATRIRISKVVVSPPFLTNATIRPKSKVHEYGFITTISLLQCIPAGPRAEGEHSRNYFNTRSPELEPLCGATAIKGVFSPNTPLAPVSYPPSHSTFSFTNVPGSPHTSAYMSGHHPATVRRAGRKRGAIFESSEALAEQPAVARSAVELHRCCARVSHAAALVHDQPLRLVRTSPPPIHATPSSIAS